MSQETMQETRCRVCNKRVQVKYTLKSPKGEEIVYFFCPCGTVFHNKEIRKDGFEPKYLEDIRDCKFFKERVDYFRRTYMPFIEEQTYGRECLDIGFGFAENIIDMQERGWVMEGIDLIKNDYITGDFESYDFKERKYDLIIMSHVIQACNDPMKALEKVVGLLKGGGLLFLVAPDSSLLLQTGYADFGHWSAEARTIFSLSNIVLELTRLGMEQEPLLRVQNFSKRFLYYNDFHLIMKKGLK